MTKITTGKGMVPRIDVDGAKKHINYTATNQLNAPLGKTLSKNTILRKIAAPITSLSV